MELWREFEREQFGFFFSLFLFFFSFIIPELSYRNVAFSVSRASLHIDHYIHHVGAPHPAAERTNQRKRKKKGNWGLGIALERGRSRSKNERK